MTDTELLERLYAALDALAPDDDAELQDLLEEAGEHLDDAVPSADWRRIDEELPNPDIEEWVVVYTEDADIGGRQFFVLHASELQQDSPSGGASAEAEAATHWMPLPFPS